MPPTVTADSVASLNSAGTVANYDQPTIPFILPPQHSGVLADTLARAESSSARLADALARGEFGVARRADTGVRAESLLPATLTLVVSPTAPTIPSTTPLGTTVATLQGVWSDGSTFTGSFTFVAPNYDADTYSISGSNLIVSSNGPGVGSAGGSIEHVTMEAVQISLTADAVTSTAPNGPPLATSAGTWSWGPTQAGRQTGGGSFQGDNVVYLNGTQIASAFLIEVHHGGQLYANNSLFGWFVWNGTQFVASAAP